MQEGDAWARAALLRQGLYRLAAATFLPPTLERIEQLADAAAVAVELGLDRFPFATTARAHVDALFDVDDVAWLGGEYVRLFEAGVDGALCPPCESFYVGEGRVRDAVATTCATLEHTYATLGLQATGGGLTTPDHLVTELEAMSALCGQEARAWTHGHAQVVGVADRGLDLLRRHLVVWLPEFTRRVHRSTHAELYLTASSLALALVHHDRLLLASLARQLAALEAA